MYWATSTLVYTARKLKQRVHGLT